MPEYTPPVLTIVDAADFTDIDPNKYIVFKREEFDRRMAALHLEVSHTIIQDITSRSLDDAVVIRHSDMFAPAALSTYVNTIEAAIELMSEYGIEDVKTTSHLRALADYFMGEAESARRHVSRIPD